MPGSNLPPPTWKGVHTFSSSAVIDAQIEAVWAVLLDFSAYPEWNEFIHTMTLVDARSTPLPSQTPAPGQSLLLTVFIPPVPASSRTDPTSRPVQRILTCDVHTHRLGWASSAPKWLMHMERWQALSVVEDEGDGKGEGEPGGEGEAGRGGKRVRTLYENREVIGGLGGWFLRAFYKRGMERGHRVLAEGLKRRVEGLEK